jgi:hypothetical protein
VSYLIDTNAISELRKRQPNRDVVKWFKRRPARSMYLSVLSLGEIRKGVDRLEGATRRAALMDWLELDLPAFFQERLLPVDRAIADQWGRLLAAAGRPLPAIDSLLAATAIRHGLTLVTRNTTDFAGMGVSLIDPWDGP